jgi:hypothetical protein
MASSRASKILANELAGMKITSTGWKFVKPTPPNVEKKESVMKGILGGQGGVGYIKPLKRKK